MIQALKGVVPDQILRRRKQGFSIPLAGWLRGPLREVTQTYLSPSSLKEVGLFNVEAVRALLKDHNSLIRNHETKIWTLLTFVMWYRLYVQKRSSL